MGKLSDSEKEKIAQGVRSLVQSHLRLGISTDSSETSEHKTKYPAANKETILTAGDTHNYAKEYM